jgi:hypothetical protein
MNNMKAEPPQVLAKVGPVCVTGQLQLILQENCMLALGEEQEEYIKQTEILILGCETVD